MGRIGVRDGRARRSRPGVEGLESRRLLAVVVVQENPIAGAGVVGTGVVTGPDENLWYLQNSVGVVAQQEVLSGLVGVFNPRNGVSTAINIAPGSTAPDVTGITVGSDGNIWVSTNAGTLVSINPTTHAVGTYAVGAIGGIVGAPGGDIWYTDPGAGKIGDFSLKTHTATEYPLPKATSDPTGITVGPGGNLWFVETSAGVVGSINPTTHAITEVPLPSSGSAPTSIAASGSKLYFSEQSLGNIGILDTAKGNAITEVFAGRTIGPLVTGSDGYIDFVLNMSNPNQSLIDSLNPATDAFVISLIPDAGPPSGTPDAVGVGPDGAVWIDMPGVLAQAAVVPAGQGAITSSVISAGGVGGTVAYGTALAGRTVYLDLKGDGKLDQGDPISITGADGWYAFNGVAPGTYTIRLVTYPGEIATGVAGPAPTVGVIAGGVSTALPFGVFSAGTTLPLSPQGDPFGTHNPDISTAEVKGLYALILGRAPDAPGEASWIAYLKGGGSLGTVAAGMLGSAEYQSHAVASYYENFLGRAGSASEINAWVSYLQGGLRLEFVVNRILNSPEYGALHSTDADFVGSLYGNVLGRTGSAADVAGWQAALASGTSRAQVVEDFLASPEALTRADAGFHGTFFAGGAYAPDVAALEAGTPQVVIAARTVTEGSFVTMANASVG